MDDNTAQVKTVESLAQTPVVEVVRATRTTQRRRAVEVPDQCDPLPRYEQGRPGNRTAYR